jgi:hypothetical protein
VLYVLYVPEMAVETRDCLIYLDDSVMNWTCSVTKPMYHMYTGARQRSLVEDVSADAASRF